jgi:hypothetical protein
MSLSTQERQAIEEDLSGSDPKLVSLLATFTRLTKDEELPRHEQIAAGGKPRGPRHQRAGRYRGPAHAWRARMADQPATLHRAGVLLWLVIAICLVAVALAVNRNNGGGSRTCPNPWLAACGAPAPTHPQRKPGGQPASALSGGWPSAERIASGLGRG